MQSQNPKEISMKVTREVIADLLPLYAAGEASPETCALVEEFLRQDEEMRQRFNPASMESLTAAAGPPLPPDLALKSLRRARGLLVWQRRLYGWGIGLTIASLGGVGILDGNHFVYHSFLRDYPWIFRSCIGLAVSCWINYFILRWISRATRL
jgi:predicted anti-sigma-YlaC factor YlaD